MQDRQAFTEQQFQNGIRLFTYQFPTPICHLEVLLPVGAGHAHSDNGMLPGSPHFLEHTQLIRSAKYKQAYELDRLIGLRGGHSNGTTYPASTHYELDIPAEEIDFGVEAMLERTYCPLFSEEDLRPERTVVINERNARKFYPGRSMVSKFYHTEFLNDAEYPLEQLFGADEDLGGMTAEVLEAMQERISLNDQVAFLAVGPGDFHELAERLASIRTNTQRFEPKIKDVSWSDPTFRYCYFDTVSQPTYEAAWLHPRLPYEEFRAASFIISLLTNPTHGALHHEFREQKGWTYGVDGYCQQRPLNTIFGISIPVNTREQVEYVRGCLLERIEAAASDQGLVEAEIRRYISSQVYNFQTACDIIGGASYDLDIYGRIHTEQEWRQAVERVADRGFRQRIVRDYFSEASMGSLCMMPERRRKVLARELPA